MTLQNTSRQREEGKRCWAAESEPIPRPHPGITQTPAKGHIRGVLWANKGLGREQLAGKWLLRCLGDALCTQYCRSTPLSTKNSSSVARPCLPVVGLEGSGGPSSCSSGLRGCCSAVKRGV